MNLKKFNELTKAVHEAAEELGNVSIVMVGSCADHNDETVNWLTACHIDTEGLQEMPAIEQEARGRIRMISDICDLLMDTDKMGPKELYQVLKLAELLSEGERHDVLHA
jgi:hypothetical protein